jgi:alpha,alpha-trehalase
MNARKLLLAGLFIALGFLVQDCGVPNAQNVPGVEAVFPEKWVEVEAYIKNNWLKYVETSETLPKPYSYALNPGTLFYWDLYFINEGLMKQGFMEQALHNIDNFIFEIGELGFIPNANGWGTDRSQTPYFAMMVRSYYEKTPQKDKEWLRKAYGAVLTEYEFWTNTNDCHIENHTTSIEGLQRFNHHSDTVSLIRFYDRVLVGRFKLSQDVPVPEKFLMASRRLAEAETMDFTPRFEGRCPDFIAVDLNSNLYQYEMNLAFFERELGIPNYHQWEKRAKRRVELINRYCWSDERGLFLDYDFVNNRHSQIAAVTTLMPLYWGFASKKQATSIKNQIALFDTPGGLATCEPSEQVIEYQWGHKAVWPPVQFIAMAALQNYGFQNEAQNVAMKYLNTVTRNFVSPVPVDYRHFKNGADIRPYGLIWEKYDRDGNINDAEYPASEMMGWAAATYLKALELIRIMRHPLYTKNEGGKGSE